MRDRQEWMKQAETKSKKSVKRSEVNARNKSEQADRETETEEAKPRDKKQEAHQHSGSLSTSEMNA